jgi:hypothetical protein
MRPHQHKGRPMIPSRRYPALQPVSPTSVKELCYEVENCKKLGVTRAAKRVGRSRRLVSFELDQDGGIKESYSESHMILTHEDRRNLWWTQLESNAIAEKARRVILHYRANREDYKSDLLHLFAHCARSSNNRLSVEDFKLADKGGRRSPRGLERHINEIMPHYKQVRGDGVGCSIEDTI